MMVRLIKIQTVFFHLYTYILTISLRLEQFLQGGGAVTSYHHCKFSQAQAKLVRFALICKIIK